MVRAGLGIGLNANRACPNFLRTDAGKIDGGFTLHARRLGCVWIECMTRDYTNAIILPFRGVFAMIVAHGCCFLCSGILPAARRESHSSAAHYSGFLMSARSRNCGPDHSNRKSPPR